MKRLFFDKNSLTGVVTDLRFLELEIRDWLAGKTRKDQLDAEKYYNGDHDIKKAKRTMVGADGEPVEIKYLPNNRIVDNQYAKMVDQIANYEMGQPITFDTDSTTSSGKAFGDALADVFDKRALRVLRTLTRRAVNEGLSWLYVWPQDGQLRFTLFPASEVLPFWADAEHTELDCAVRMYDVIEYNDREEREVVKHAEVYDGNGIHRFIYKDGHLKEDTDAPAVPYLTVTNGNNIVGYNWQKMPLILFRANDRETPLLLKCKSLQDALNRLLSDFANVMEENANKTILVIRNYDGTNWQEFRKNLAASGIIFVRTVDGADGGVETLTIEIDANNYKLAADLLKRAIIENCGGFDAKDERLNNNPNQMNIQSMYADIEMTGNALETEFSGAFENLMWFVKQHLKQTGKGDFEAEKADVIFNRDTMVNESEVIENCRNSVGIISNETIVKNHSWVDDPTAELERIKKEQEEQMQEADVYQAAFENSRDPARGVTGYGGETE